MMMDAAPKLTAKQAERFSRLAMPLLPLLLRAAVCLTRRSAEAEDLVQETMIKAMRAMDRFEEGTDIKAWLMTIMRRAHIDVVRGNKRHAEVLPLEEANVAADLPDERGGAGGEFDAKWTEPAVLMERFGDEEVIEALQGLPEEIRWTLLMVDVEQMDHVAVAAVLEVPVGTIKSRAHRGRAMLRDKLYVWAKERGWVLDEESSHA